MKSKTHIYMANMILKEIKETEAVSIDGLRKYTVPSDVISAITNHPEAFRAGAVGPDFFPDMIVGQTAIHPSDSGKWLNRMEKELLSMSHDDKEWEESYAFYLGFHMHYCGDMYGHDYVNDWAKGSFPDMTEAIKNVELAKIAMRHILVESYMDEKVPASEDLTLSAPIDFVFRCFANDEAVELYPDSNTNVLRYMVDLKKNLHKNTQNQTIRTLDLFNYFPSWEKDVNEAIYEWLKLWNRIAGYLVQENSMIRTKDDIFAWLKYWGPKLTALPGWFVSGIKIIGEIAEFLDVFKYIEEAFKAAMKDVLKAFVYAVTGISEDDIDRLVKYIDDFFKNPKVYLNNGILYNKKNITDTLDKEFGNYGVSNDVHNQTFLAYNRCMNMCRMAVMGANNLNSLVSRYYNKIPMFEEKPLRAGFNKLDITIKTGTDTYSGTDDNIYFAVILKNGRALEILLDKPGYNDFENGDNDTYRFDLPETVYYEDIDHLRIRKDYITADDDWKMQHVRVVDVSNEFVLADAETNVWMKKRASYRLGANIKQSDVKLSVDARVMNHLYSLDGACPENMPDYKPWNEPKLFLNANSELRKKVLLPAFSLQNGTGVIPCIRYDAHVAYKGWLSEVCSGETAGTTGESRQIEAIEIKLIKQ